MFSILFEIHWNALLREAIGLSFGIIKSYHIAEFMLPSFFVNVPVFSRVERLISLQFIFVNEKFENSRNSSLWCLRFYSKYCILFELKLFYSIIWRLNHMSAIAMAKDRNKKMVLIFYCAFFHRLDRLNK